MIKKNSPEYTALVNLKSKAYALVGYKKDDKRKYITLNSSVLFPNNANLNDNDPLEHLFVVNAPQDKYVSILKELFNEFIKNNIPVNFSVRDITDMVYGFADPIKIYVSTKYIEQAANIIYNVMKDKKLPKDYQPNDLLYLNMNGLFGYTTVDKAGRTPMDVILNKMERSINTKILASTSDWTVRQRVIKDYYNNRNRSNRYTDLINTIVNGIDFVPLYSDSSNFDEDEISKENRYIFPGIFPREEEVQEEVDLPEMHLGYSKSKEDTIDPELIDEPINDVSYIGDEPQEEIKEEPKQEEEEPTLDNTGVYTEDNIKVDKLSDEEAYSIVFNEPTKMVPLYAEEYKDISLDLGEYKSVIERGIQDICPVTVDSDGRYTELIKYLKAQKVSELFDKDIILKDGKRISGREYAKSIVIPQFLSNTVNEIHTLEELNKTYVDEIVEKENTNGNFLSKIFKKSK